MSHFPTQQQVNRLKIDNMLRPETLAKIPKTEWPTAYRPQGIKEVWRSRYFLVQVFEESKGIERLSVCVTDVDMSNGRWKDGISWEELQDIKRQVGRGDKDAVEVYPADADVVNVANMRHLFVMPTPLSYVWRKSQSTRDTGDKI